MEKTIDEGIEWLDADETRTEVRREVVTHSLFLNARCFHGSDLL